MKKGIIAVCFQSTFGTKESAIILSLFQGFYGDD